MSRREYPYISAREKYRGRPRSCGCCAEQATHEITVQLSIFRGDDESYVVCESHAALAKANFEDFVHAFQKRQHYMSEPIRAQHEETGREWSGKRRDLPPRYLEFSVSEFGNAI